MSIETTSPVPRLSLTDGHTIPQLGFGVFKVPPDDTEAIVATALEAGYRHIDTARLYENEQGVGAAVAASGLPREELFITTKVWNDDQGRERTRAALQRSLELLGLDYVDLYLIHWPVPGRGLYLETWETLAELRDAGLTRSIGVSNFTVAHLERILAATGEPPVVNQVELHPRLQQPELRRFHDEHGIRTEAWAPLARGGLLEDEAVAAVARRHGRTPAQVILRWHLQLGTVVIPKSATPARVRENFALFDFALDEQDMAALGALEAGARIGPDPDTFG